MGIMMSRPTTRMATRPTPALPPLATTCGLPQLPLALGFALRRRLRRQGRCLYKLLGSLGSPNDLDQDRAIFRAPAVDFNTLPQRQPRFGAQLHFLETLEPLQSSPHSGLHLSREKSHPWRF